MLWNTLLNLYSLAMKPVNCWIISLSMVTEWHIIDHLSIIIPMCHETCQLLNYFLSEFDITLFNWKYCCLDENSLLFVEVIASSYWSYTFVWKKLKEVFKIIYRRTTILWKFFLNASLNIARTKWFSLSLMFPILILYLFVFFGIAHYWIH